MMPVFGTWKFTLTAQNALMSAAKWLGKAPTTPDMAFDDLREAVRKGDRNAARAMVLPPAPAPPCRCRTRGPAGKWP